ncbi:MAG TPA: hypothetical protein PLK35_00865 [Candidatus Moranbacteria bacterium]|nr:hypothetical protein [Candidatus Moranbacteria bacterium]
MISYFKKIVLDIAKDRGCELLNSATRTVENAEKDLEDGKIDLSTAISKIKEEKEIRLKFTGDDFRKIEREVGYNIRK